MLKEPVQHRLAVRRLARHYGIVEHENGIDIYALKKTPKPYRFSDFRGIAQPISLNLSGRYISDHDIIVGKKSPRVTRLILDYNHIDGRLFGKFSTSNSPEEVYLNNNPLTDRSIVGLANLPIVTLEIGYNSIGDESVATLTTLKSLKSLSIHQCEFSEAGIAALEAGLPECTIFVGTQR